VNGPVHTEELNFRTYSFLLSNCIYLLKDQFIYFLALTMALGPPVCKVADPSQVFKKHLARETKMDIKVIQSKGLKKHPNKKNALFSSDVHPGFY